MLMRFFVFLFLIHIIHVITINDECFILSCSMQVMDSQTMTKSNRTNRRNVKGAEDRSWFLSSFFFRR